MIEFGQALRAAREAKGYSISQLAEKTRILPQIIDNLENENFSKIVAPIYGRGFVKLYCEAVDIDSQPLIAEFMEIYNGNRPPTIRLRDIGSAETEPPATGEPPAEEPVDPSAAEEPAVVLPAAEEPPEPCGPLFAPPEPEPTAEATETRSARPLLPPHRDYRMPGYSMPEVPRSFWRFFLLAVSAGVIVTLLVFGCRMLYRVTMRVPVEATDAAPEAEPAAPAAELAAPTPEAATVPRAPRKPVDIPPLYID